MTSYEDALAAIRERTTPLGGTESVDLASAVGRVLLRPLVSVRPNPSFDNSAVDGYLLGAPSAPSSSSFEVVGEARAGGEAAGGPGPGQAMRIFTGAPVPAGDFCIVMQEDVSVRDGSISLHEAVTKSWGIRRAGTDFEAGVELAAAGTRIGAPEVALAAWNGADRLEVFERPRVAVAVTGDELIPLGSPLGYGQIHDSNGPMLSAVARSLGAEVVESRSIGDRIELVEAGLAAMAERADLVVVSGGASVGDYDHVPAAVARLGEVYWHGVSIKPGKPTLFGRIGNSIVFGLPGNPSSAYVCYQLFVRPCLRRMAGEKSTNEVWVSARFDGEHSGANRDEFVRIRLEVRGTETWASPVFEQGSFGLRSLAAAHALARLNLMTTYRPGDPVSCMILPAARL